MAKLRVKEIADQRKINQSRLQIQSGVTSRLLGRYWHNKTSSIDLVAIEKIAKALGVSSGELIIDDEAATT